MSMDRKTVDLGVLVLYIVAVFFCAFVVPAAVGPVVIFGAAAVAAWFSFVRPVLKEKERQRMRREDGAPPPYFE